MSFSSFPQVWQQVAFHLLDDWGQFSTAFAVTSDLSDEQYVHFRRELEIDGSYFYQFDMNHEMAQDMSAWLHQTLPSLWGKNQDLIRMTMLFRCSADCDLNRKFAEYSSLARQFPFPFVFLLSPEEDWRSWKGRNQFLFDEKHEYL